MSDFNKTLYNEPLRGGLSTFSKNSALGQMLAVCGLGMSITSQAWPANNRAIFVPVHIEFSVVVLRMAVRVQTQSGNLDLGLYDETGRKRVGLGSTAVAAAGVQIGDIADTPLNPGTYYLAMNCDNTTAIFRGTTLNAAVNARLCGVQQQDVGAITLPATATFTALSSSVVPAVFCTYRPVF